MEFVRETILSKLGQIDYIQDDKLHVGGNAPCVMINTEADLSSLPDIYPPGTVAFIAGFQKIWQLSADHSWISVI